MVNVLVSARNERDITSLKADIEREDRISNGVCRKFGLILYADKNLRFI